jgi:hypothetical protein
VILPPSIPPAPPHGNEESRRISLESLNPIADNPSQCEPLAVGLQTDNAQPTTLPHSNER